MLWFVALTQVEVGMGCQHSVYNPYVTQSILQNETTKRSRSSPVQSPVVAIKSKWHCQTLTEQSPHTETIVPNLSLNSTTNTRKDVHHPQGRFP